MSAIDTIASFQVIPASAYGVGIMAPGDSNVIRNAPVTADVRVLAAMYDADAAGNPWRVRSPLLHDNVQGIRFVPPVIPEVRPLPKRFAQRLHPQDALNFEFVTTAVVGVSLGVLSIYYSDLPGASARLYAPGDIAPLVENVKPVLVTCPFAGFVAGAWNDFLLTLTEALLKANTDYAVLGYTTDTELAVIAIRGSDTANLRIGGPGTLNTDITAEYFADLSDASMLPTIPVINSANAGATVVSLASSVAPIAAVNVMFYLAELSQNLPG